jgi:spermidine synthase
MFGLGFGGYVGGRVAKKTKNPLRLYGFLEICVALLAFSLPFSFSTIGEIYRAGYSSFSVIELTMLRFMLAFLAVSPATFFMGMTLPVLTQFKVQKLNNVGKNLGELYSANTLGAFAGTIVSGFFLIELLGLSGTADVAICLNLIVGVIAIFASRHQVVNEAGSSKEKTPPETKIISYQKKRLILGVTFISGFVSLSLEILWTRMLAEGTGSLIYIFVIVLALYLLGIGLGSSLYKRRSNDKRDSLSALGVCLGVVGLLATLTVIVGSGIAVKGPLLINLILLLPATSCMGYAFPLAGKLITPSVEESGSSIGKLYAFNTAGSILGAFSAAFLLAGTIGTNNSIILLAALNLTVGTALVVVDLRSKVSSKKTLAFILATASILIVLLPALNLPISHTLTQNYLSSRGLLVSHQEDYLATVDSSTGLPKNKRLFVLGVGMTNLTIDTKLMAYLPKSLRPQASSFLAICFGMGSTYRSSLILGMQTDAVELSPSVPGQMGVFYNDAQQYLGNPNGHIIEADGRNYARLTNKKYDIITVDPPPPIQSAGTVVLYTKEFIQQSKARLNPNGIFQLWIPNQETVADFKTHVRTFREEFKHMVMIFGPGGNGVYLIGSDASLTFDNNQINKLFGTPQAQADLAGAPDFSPLDATGWVNQIHHDLWLSDQAIDFFIGPGPIITDDHPLSEYFLIRALTTSEGPVINEKVLRQVSK